VLGLVEVLPASLALLWRECDEDAFDADSVRYVSL